MLLIVGRGGVRLLLHEFVVAIVVIFVVLVEIVVVATRE
jgi:hypothetical protein